MQKKSSKFLGKKQGVNQIGQHERSAHTAKAVQDVQADHDGLPVGASSFLKAATSPAIAPHSTAMAVKNAMSMTPLRTFDMGTRLGRQA